MKMRSRMIASYAVTLVVCLVASCRALAEDNQCTIHSLHGTYVVSIAGFIANAAAPQFSISGYSPVTVIGTYAFDGMGHVSRSLKVNLAGQPIPVTDAGTYQVNADCSGTTTFPTNRETLSFTPIDARTSAIVSITPGESGAGILIKQTAKNCQNETLRGVWIYSGNGLGTFQAPPQAVDAFFPVAVSGTWTFDGKGGVSRSLALNFAGLPGPYADSGTYQVNSDCTASVNFPSDAEPFNLVVVNSRSVVYGVAAVGRAGTGMLRKQQLTP